MLVAFILVSQGRSKALIDAGAKLPEPVQIRALVDTGASCTCLDPEVLATLGLTPTGTTSVVTAGGVPEERDVYDVALAIPSGKGEQVFFEHTMAVVAAPLLKSQGFHALIGRDVLSRCILNYNGSTKTYTLAY